MGQGDRQGLEAIGLQQAWQIANGLRQLRQFALVVFERAPSQQ
jgi:hypothetical protein